MRKGGQAAREENAFFERLLARDEHAYAALVARHQAELVRLARSFVRDDGIAEEVVQDAWLAVLAGLPRFEQRASLKTWIARIVVNIARTRGVRERRLPSNVMPRDDARSPEAELLDREALALVRRALRKLPAHQQQVVVLSDLEGVDPNDVCKILGVSATNLRVLHHRARAKLREALAAA